MDLVGCVYVGGGCPGLGTSSSNIPAAHCANHSAS